MKLLPQRQGDIIHNRYPKTYLGGLSSLSMAERLSHNRALRRAAVDVIPVEHINNIYHLHRKIEDMYSLTGTCVCVCVMQPPGPCVWGRSGLGFIL